MTRLLVTVLAISLTACSSAPKPSAAAEEAPRGRYRAEAGEMTVGIIAAASIRDDARNRDIALAIDYPTRATAASPVIVFSHAIGASELDYATYASHWASNGYVVVRVGHADAVRGFARNGENSIAPTTAAEWVKRAHDRVRDLDLVVDALPTIEQRYPELAGKVDATRVGVAGHAFGSLAALLAGGVRTEPDGPSHDRARIKAVLAMSPPGPGERRGLSSKSFAGLTLPSLFLTGTKDIGGDETETPQWRIQGFEATAPGDKWLVVLNGAGRNTFSGLVIDEHARQRPINDPWAPGVSSPRDPDSATRRLPGQSGQGYSAAPRSVVGHARIVTLAFWDAYLRDDAAGRELLQGLTSRGWAEVRQR
ncbi:MAG: hypothetical protein WA208_20990 [Thermoanaerobaculia bacterium]